MDDEGFYPLGDAVRWADEADPTKGLVFDGRLVENFKLATGAFVAAGTLRTRAVSALGGLVVDAVVCGENQPGVGLMLFLNPQAVAALDSADLAAPHTCPAVLAHVTGKLTTMNAAAKGLGERILRALLLDGAPDAASGELTDKGYLNQATARARRPSELARLFAETPDAGVIVL